MLWRMMTKDAVDSSWVRETPLAACLERDSWAAGSVLGLDVRSSRADPVTLNCPGVKQTRSPEREVEKAISREIAFVKKLPAQSAWTFSACQPLGPLVTSNCTRSEERRVGKECR